MRHEQDEQDRRLRVLLRQRRLRTAATIGCLVFAVIIAAVRLHCTALDERSTAELVFDGWAQRVGYDIYSRRCLSERARGSDGRVPCGVVFADLIECEGEMYCGTRRATVWCAGDSTRERAPGCVWR